MEPTSRSARPGAMPNARRLPLLVVGAVVLAAACSSGAVPSASPPGSPSGGSPSASPEPTAGALNGIEHPTGAKDVVLRYEEGPGFVMAEFAVTMAPIFTLYGDGTIVFRDPMQPPPENADGVMRNPAFRTAKLSEEQIQALLEFAANEGGLGTARDHYEHNGVADAGTAIFTINAGGREKQVSVYALGIEGPGTPDEAARAQFGKLAERLRTFDDGGQVPTSEYEPAAMRAFLFEAAGMVDVPVRDWPWDDLTPADFKKPADPNGPQFPVLDLTPDQVAALGIDDVSGGAQSIYLEDPDGKVWSLALRPILPDEEA
jgi:hypothetical protein